MAVPTFYQEDPATEIDISDLLARNNFIRTSLACITMNGNSDDTGQSFSKIKLNKILDVTGQLYDYNTISGVLNFNAITLGSRTNTERSSSIYPLWIDQTNKKLIIEAKETDPLG